MNLLVGQLTDRTLHFFIHALMTANRAFQRTAFGSR